MTQPEDPPAKLVPGTTGKMPPIPQGAKIQKRPLTRRQLPASSKTPVIYVSSKSPFMSVVKRTRKFLDKALRNNSSTSKNLSLHARVEALKRDSGSETARGATVTVMGTGKAIEKTLSVASWFEQQGDCVVKIRTRTIGTVDDVVVEDADDAFGDDNESRLRKKHQKATQNIVEKDMARITERLPLIGDAVKTSRQHICRQTRMSEDGYFSY